MRNLLFVLFTIFSIISLSKILLVSPVYAAGAVLSLSPVNQDVNVGDSLTTTISLSTNGEQINRVLVKLNYPASILTPQSIDSTGSFITLWYQQSTTTPGTIILEGGISGSGTSGSQLFFAKVNFTTKEAGTAELTFNSESAVYKESDGTNILSETQPATYNVGTSSVTSTPTISASLSPSEVISGTPTPSTLPNGGTVSPTIIFIITAVITSIIGAVLLLR